MTRKKYAAIAGILLLAAGGAAAYAISKQPKGGKPSVTISAQIISSGATTKRKRGGWGGASIMASLESAVVPVTVRLTATVTGGVTPYTFAWDFGDSSPAGTGNPVTHSYSYEGVYTVKVTVADAVGESVTASGDLNLSSGTALSTPVVASQYAKGGSVFLVQTVLKDSSNNPLLNETVVLLQGTTQVGSVTTDSTGTASFSVTAPTTPGTYQYTAQFAGVSGVLAASASSPVTVTVYAPLSVTVGAA